MKSSKIVSLAVVGLTLSLTGCFGDKEPEPDATSAPIELEFSETKKNTADELKKYITSDDLKTNKALISEDGILLVTYATKDCVVPPNSVQLTEGNTLLIETPEAKSLLECKGDVEPHGWDIETPKERAKDIRSAQLTYPSGISGGLIIYTETRDGNLPEEPAQSPEEQS